MFFANSCVTHVLFFNLADKWSSGSSSFSLPIAEWFAEQFLLKTNLIEISRFARNWSFIELVVAVLNFHEPHLWFYHHD